MGSTLNEIKQGGQFVLVVDDEVQVRDLLAESLEFMGHEVQTATDGKDAQEKTETQRFDIVLTDMDMPRMDGMELIRYLKERNNGIDIIAITGHTLKYKYTDVIAAGAADFITKPFTLDELEAKLGRLIRERCQRKELENLAIRDPLTGVYNRRHFEQVSQKEVVRAVRYGHHLAILYMDIDSFKDFNDVKGHHAGDQLLERFAEVLRQSTREHVDSIFRFGGDEFTVLLPHLSGAQARVVAERIISNYDAQGFDPTSLSIGIAEFETKTGEIDRDIEDMADRADKALYVVKRRRDHGGILLDGDGVA